MRTIIRQNPVSLALPDFRNLGTILRVVVAANGAAAVAAIVQQPQLEQWSGEFIANAGTLEPGLLLVLVVLYTVSPWLSRQPYATGASVVAGITVVTTIVIHALIDWIVPMPPGSLLRHLVLGLLLALARSSLISICGRRRCRRRSPRRGCRRCRRAFARISCSTASTP